MIRHMMALAIVATCSGDAERPAQDRQLGEIVAAVEGRYSAYKEMQNLRIRFSMEYSNVEGPRNFAFDTVSVDLRRRPGMRWLRLDGLVVGGRRLTRIYAWDGKLATSLEPRDAKSGEYYMSFEPTSNIYYYDYFDDFMSYPDGTGSAQSVSTGVEDKWLPKLLTNRLADCVLRPTKEEVDGTPCFVVELPRREVFWLDPQRGCALRKRESFDPLTGTLKERTLLSDFAEIGGIWLPREMTREEFLRDGRPHASKVLKVVEISDEPIPDSQFRILAPIGVEVHDITRKVFFTHYTSGHNAVIDSAEAARAQITPSARREWFAGALAAALACILGVVAIFAWHRSGSRRK